MCGKVFAFIFVLVALLLAITASVLPQDRLTSIIHVYRFFDIMLPILAVGALTKYLFSCNWGWKRKEHIDTVISQ